MTWTPTAGMKLAKPLLLTIRQDAEAAGCPLEHYIEWRLYELVYKALDQALADGAEQGAMERATANTTSAGVALTSSFQVNNLSSPLWTNGNGHADPDKYAEPWATFHEPAILDDHMPDAPQSEASVASAVEAMLARHVEVVEAPKKRRGRPPGSKAKAAKPAKAKRKSAKAKDDAMAPGWVNRALKGDVEAPVADYRATQLMLATASHHRRLGGSPPECQVRRLASSSTVEHRAVNAVVAGSSPASSAMIGKGSQWVTCPATAAPLAATDPSCCIRRSATTRHVTPPCRTPSGALSWHRSRTGVAFT